MARLSELIRVDPAISRDRRPIRTRAAPGRSLKFIDKAQGIDVESGLIAGWEDGGGALPAEVADATAKAGDGFFRQAETLIVEVGERPASGRGGRVCGIAEASLYEAICLAEPLCSSGASLSKLCGAVG